MLNREIQEILDLAPKFVQRQDSISDQLNDLVIIANKFGMYDAADCIKRTLISK